MIRYLRVAPLWVLVSTVVAALATGCPAEEAACDGDGQCPGGYVCELGQCVPEGCRGDEDCAGDETCDDGICRPADADLGVTVDSGLPDGLPDGVVIGPDGLPIRGETVGGACAEDTDCRVGLACTDTACAPAGATAEGGLCSVSGECAEGLSCGFDVRCGASAGVPLDHACSAPTDCAPGLRCDLVGLIGVCQPEGTGDLGQECAGDGECLAPLSCSEGACQIPAFAGFPLFEEIECEPIDEDGPFRSYFEVPGQTPSADFFRLPYPSDVRRTDTGVDLSGFPRFGADVIAGPVFDGIVEALESSGRGFSTNPTIIFRFSRGYDFGTVDGSGDDASLVYANIDPDSPNYGNGVGASLFMTSGRSAFICHNYMTVRTSWTNPLEHDTTYAVYLTTGIRSSDGEAAAQDEDLAAVLGAQRPSGRLGAAWDAYAPFRDYAAAQGIDVSTIANVAVFTTMDPDDHLPGIRRAVRAREANAALQDLTLCADGVESPCADGDARACVNADGLIELHATFAAPVWQRGTRPYLAPGDGGGVEYERVCRTLDEELGEVCVPEPIEQDTEDLCLSIALPTTPMPETGWPVVMYGPGTGGTFVSGINSGVAASLADVRLGGGDTVAFATVTIEGVSHGARRGESSLDPEVLFFNVANPEAALGNVEQGAADFFALTRLLEELDVDAADSPTGEALRFDAANLYFYGHSQGSTVGAPFVAYEPNVRAAVFSGAGGGLVEALLAKTNPVDVAAAVRAVLNETSVDDDHPVLNLLQQLVDPVDAVNYGRLILRSPPADRAPTHVLQGYGVGDTFTPDRTLEIFGVALGVHTASPAVVTSRSLPEVELPASGNRTTRGTPVTAVMLQVEPDGYDGHFVLTRNAAARDQVAHFLGTAVRDGTPTVPAP